MVKYRVKHSQEVSTSLDDTNKFLDQSESIPSKWKSSYQEILRADAGSGGSANSIVRKWGVKMCF